MNEYMCVPIRIHNTKNGLQQIILSPNPSTHNTGDTWQGNAHGELMSLKRAQSAKNGVYSCLPQDLMPNLVFSYTMKGT